MLSIDEARAAVLAEARPLPIEEVEIGAALGRVLAADVTAAGDVPGFANSAMDGFAVRSGPADRTLTIVGESRAGAPAAVKLADGEAIRISTGAMLPVGADAVVRVEDTERDGDQVLVRVAVTSGNDIRRAGEDIAAGETVLTAGALLGPAELGALFERAGFVLQRVIPTAGPMRIVEARAAAATSG